INKEKINILLIGMGGGAADGPELTDTIILTSLNTKKQTVSMLSIPRDLYVTYPSGGGGKINELYRLGLKALPENKTTKFLEDKISEITGEKIDYYFNIDFTGFSKFIDLIDGIEIDVPEDLVDTEYPDWNWGYTTFSVKKGLQTFNGETALKYARSRHSTSDFDRSLRQQLVLKAVKDKLFNLKYIANPSKISEFYNTLNSNIKTNLGIKEIISFARFIKEIPNENIFSFNLNDSCFQGINFCRAGGFLYNPERALFGGAAVLLPDSATSLNVSNYSVIIKFADIIFNYSEIFKENYEINFINSTKSNGLANKFAIMLKKYGFNIPEKNSIFSTKDKFKKTQTYYLWDSVNKIGVDPSSKTLEMLGQFIFTDQTPVTQAKYSKSLTSKIEIVLGDDYKLFLNN
ncbi:LCP family protein, partial [Candidatus Gracilibacteria bacterium]|nr:LCP family protein [Candidatus Gracilibacteria bacterium]